MGDVIWYFARICDVLDVKMYELMVNEYGSKLISRRSEPRDKIIRDGDFR